MFIKLFYSAADCMRVGGAGSRTNRNIFASKPWWDTVCESFKNRKMQALRLFKTMGNMINLADYLSLRNNYKNLCRNKKHEYKNKQRQKLVDSRKNPSTFWKLLKNNVTSIKSNIHPHTWYNYFKVLFSLDMQSEIGDPDVIQKLKRNKAFAGNQLLNEYFIESCDILLGHLVDLFNGILNSGHFPDQWSQGIIVPLFKKNDPNDVNNYRGVTLVSCFSKIFTGVLNKRLTDGFRRGRSTTDAIFVLHAVVQKVLNEKGRLFCAFVDFQKAFDSVYLNGLWFKLFKLGINGKMLRIFKDMYNQVKTCVRACNSYSEFFECAVGLKQGEVISPLFFSLFIDDLELFLQDDPNCGLNLDDITFILMLFADDMVILGNTIADLQHGLDLLHTYCTRWGIQVNTDKTKILVFRKRGRLKDNGVWTYDGAKLEVVNDFNYLGTRGFQLYWHFCFKSGNVNRKRLKGHELSFVQYQNLLLNP